MVKVKCRKCKQEFLWEGEVGTVKTCIFCNSPNLIKFPAFAEEEVLYEDEDDNQRVV